MDEALCNRCGLCCHFEIDGKDYVCKYLMKHGSRTFCRNYKNKHRLNKPIYVHTDGTKVYCIERIKDKHHYPGCPYNKLIKVDTDED